MPHHNEASVNSRELCLGIFRELNNYIPKIKRKETEIYCTASSDDRTQFVQVYHRNPRNIIRVYFNGPIKKMEEINRRTSLNILTDKSRKSFQHYIIVEDIKMVPNVAKIVYKLSYLKS
jgi:hypothetical protein